MTTLDLYGTNGELIELANCEFDLLVQNHPTDGMLGLPPVSFNNRRAPTLTAGSLGGTARKEDRPVGVRVRFNPQTSDELRGTVEQLARMLDPEWGDCRIVSGRTDGTKRDIVATYTAGLQPRVTMLAGGRVTADCSLVFRAHHPYWRALDETEESIVFPVTGTGLEGTDWDDPDADWDDPTLDWDGVAASEEESTSIIAPEIRSTAPSWPSWRFEGPLLGVELSNTAAGAVFAWSGVVDAGEVLEIDFDELSRHIRVDGVSVWVGKDPGSRFWSLKPGSATSPQPNQIIVHVPGAETTTTATMRYRPQWLSP